MLVQVVEHDGDVGATAQFENDSHSLAVGLITHLANAIDLASFDEFGDLRDKGGLVDLERNLGKYQSLAFLPGDIFDFV